MALHMKTGDTWPVLQGELTSDDVPVTLTGSTVRFLMAKPDGTIVINNPATIVNAAQGVVQYAWQPADTATAGKYLCEFRVTFGDGKVTSLPNDGYMEVIIVEAL
jgi:hypothetical protein